MNLSGVGPQMEAKLLRAFENQEGIRQALLDERLDELLAIEGVSEKRAIAWIHAAKGTETAPFASTPAAVSIQQSLVDLARSYASTSHGKTRARLLTPLTTPEQAAARQQEILAWKQKAQSLPRQEIRAALRKLQPLREPRPVLNASALVVAESNEAYEQLHALGVGKWAHLGTKRDLEQAEQYESVLIAYDDGLLPCPDYAEEIPANSPLTEFCPHAARAWLKENHATLEGLQQLAALLHQDTAVPEAPPVHLSDLPTASDLTRFCWQLAKELDEEVRSRTQDLALTGSELLESVSRGGLPKRMESIVQDVLQEGAGQILMEYGLDLQPFLPGVPIAVDEDGIDAALHEARRNAGQASVREQRAFAKELEAAKPKLREELERWFRFDVDFSLGCLAVDYELKASAWSDQLQFEEGRHLGLREHAQPIAYQLGGEHQIAVLTGANSGGKSTLLELLSQIMIMARMGLPVPASNCLVPWVAELHLVTASKGLDAGAFETFLKGFLPIVQGDKKRMVFADEVEAVTELEAASRILGFFMDQLGRTESMGVIVTHLAEQVLAHATAKIRVDGIEAVGLDENHQLVVDRCPKLGHFARSTPELIIQRMSNLSKGPRKELYDALLATFGGTRVSTPF